MLVSAIHRHESAIGTRMCPPSWASSPTSHPIHPSRLSQSTGSELPVLQTNFPLVIYFTHGNGYVSMLLSQFVPPSPSPTVPTSLFSMSASLLLPYRQVHQYQHLSRFYIYVLMQDICSSLSNLLHSVLKALRPSTSLELSQIRSFLWLSVILFNWYKYWIIFLPGELSTSWFWLIVFSLELRIYLSMFTMSCS